MKNSILEIGETVPAPILMRAEHWSEQTARWSPSQDGVEPILPKGERWPELLGLDQCGAAEHVLHRALLAPIAGLTSVRGKRIRGQLVALSYHLLCGDSSSSAFGTARCRLAGEAIEFIHAGSLIVDDIEDGSPVRRGRPALHLRYPMSIALNAGNWLYFWPFDLLKQLGAAAAHLRSLPSNAAARSFRSGHRSRHKNDTLAQAQVREVCLASMRLKTGALMGFAAYLGAAVAGAPSRLAYIVFTKGWYFLPRREIGAAGAFSGNRR